MQKGVPFEPEELLEPYFSRRRRRTLDAMLEMHQVLRVESLRGAYLADTLYVREYAEVTGDTVVLVNHVVFEGRSPKLKGNYAIFFYPQSPVTCLPGTLERSLAKGGFGKEIPDRLPPYSVIHDLDLNVACRKIEMNTSGSDGKSGRPGLPGDAPLQPGLPQFPPDPVPIQKPPE